MSIHRDRNGWRVFWRVSGKQRTRSFAKKADAITFDADLKRRRHLGPRLAAELARESMTLRDYVAGPFRSHVATLAQPTRAKYRWAIEKRPV
jgi:hypothetical protein